MPGAGSDVTAPAGDPSPALTLQAGAKDQNPDRNLKSWTHGLPPLPGGVTTVTAFHSPRGALARENVPLVCFHILLN